MHCYPAQAHQCPLRLSPAIAALLYSTSDNLVRRVQTSCIWNNFPRSVVFLRSSSDNRRKHPRSLTATLDWGHSVAVAGRTWSVPTARAHKLSIVSTASRVAWIASCNDSGCHPRTSHFTFSLERPVRKNAVFLSSSTFFAVRQRPVRVETYSSKSPTCRAFTSWSLLLSSSNGVENVFSSKSLKRGRESGLSPASQRQMDHLLAFPCKNGATKATYRMRRLTGTKRLVDQKCPFLEFPRHSWKTWRRRVLPEIRRHRRHVCSRV